MSDLETAVAIAALLLRMTLGVTMLAHGWNHVWGGGKIAGTARWFGSIGFRAPKAQAWLASITELGAGVALVVGLLTPLAAAAVAGTMTVALVANHIRNGFFIFRPGEGYEYVAMILVASLALAALGGGEWSLDELAGIGVDPVTGLGIGAGGVVLGLVVLAIFWRPKPRSS
ncbi:MAG TPA: DoxX family protein [Acidimicrobiales bacterium]|jgi:putative oxidoreductase|nr:DoxX family protein [Acidimicrobiales bacterium]